MRRESNFAEETGLKSISSAGMCELLPEEIYEMGKVNGPLSQLPGDMLR